MPQPSDNVNGLGLSSPLPDVLVNPRFPAGAKGSERLHMTHGFAYNVIVQLSAFRIALVHHRPVFADPESLGLSGGIDIGPQEQELPAVLFSTSKETISAWSRDCSGLKLLRSF